MKWLGTGVPPVYTEKVGGSTPSSPTKIKDLQDTSVYQNHFCPPVYQRVYQRLGKKRCPAETGVREIRKRSIRFVTVVGTGLVLWAIVSGQYVHALQFLRGISTGAGL